MLHFSDFADSSKFQCTAERFDFDEVLTEHQHWSVGNLPGFLAWLLGSLPTRLPQSWRPQGFQVYGSGAAPPGGRFLSQGSISFWAEF